MAAKTHFFLDLDITRDPAGIFLVLQAHKRVIELWGRVGYIWRFIPASRHYLLDNRRLSQALNTNLIFFTSFRLRDFELGLCWQVR